MIKANTALDMGQVFAPGGLISRSLPAFEARPQQVEMACAAWQTLTKTRHLAVEAGTGVGKSFAYLVPAIVLARRHACKILVSTFTIALQEQLINKDIPFLAEALPQNFTAVLAKGRGNYLCKRRLEFVLRKQRGLFNDVAAELALIKSWADTTSDGSLSDLHFLPGNHAWDKVKSEHGNCRGRKCHHFHNCFYWRARRKLETADIIVANHALLFSDLVLREQGVSILPDYRYVILDEAHNVERVAEQHFGIDLSNRRIKFLLDGLYNPQTHRGLLAYTDSQKTIELVRRTATLARTFFKQVRIWYQQTKSETNGRCHRNFVDDTMSGHLKNLRSELARLAKQTEDIDEKFELLRFTDRCEALVQQLEDFLLQKKPDSVYWVQLDGGTNPTVRLKSAPINVGPDVKRCLFDKYQSVIMTSATLSTAAEGDKSGFDFFTSRIGLDDFDALRLGSPFDYQNQVTVYIEKDLPSPNDADFVDSAAEAMKKYILKTAGRAFVLFTSYAMLGEMAAKLSKWLLDNGLDLLQQGSTADRTTLLKQFKGPTSSVLFGTDSFWQGIDVPGEALSNVIIVRLPFAVPDQPLLLGRLEQIRQRGGNPFHEYQLPSAVIKFKQGFGRLIRTKTDTGIVVILDSRIIKKAYGAGFLAAIPKCKVEIVATDK